MSDKPDFGARLLPKRSDAPSCSKCRHMRVLEDKSIVCGHWKELNPIGCLEFSDASKPKGRQVIFHPDMRR